MNFWDGGEVKFGDGDEAKVERAETSWREAREKREERNHVTVFLEKNIQCIASGQIRSL